MKKITSLFAILLAFVMLFAACGGTATTVTTATTEATGGTTAGSNGTTSTTGTTAEPVTPPEKKSIKILSIGNSFSDDATKWLGYILLDMGYTDIYLGNLYIGGCSLDTHWANIESGEAAYTYRTTQWGNWKDSKQSINKALVSKDWDVITIQQVSQNSGMPETFGNLQNILDYINENKTNKDAKVYWHATWAYESDSTHSGFPNYDKDQMKMYNAIIGAAKEKILTNSAIAGVLPSGTAIQNLRTSYLGDHLTRDGYHLSYDVGRYTAALTWAKVITGESIDEVDYVPKEYPNVANHLDAIKDAVNKAVEKPLEITASKYPTCEAMTMTAKDKDFLTAQGKNPDDYYLLDLDIMLKSYYQSTANSTRNSKYTGSKALNLDYFFSTDIFNRDDLPYGTIIRIDAGYQYRPEGWISLSEKTVERPENTSENVVVVDSEWWGDFAYRAFNIAFVESNKAIGEDDVKAFQIYVPKTPATEEPKPIVPEEPTLVDKSLTEELTQADRDFLLSMDLAPDDYGVLKMTPVVSAYYNSGDGSSLSSLVKTANNSPQFWATEEKFTKAELPVGSIITIADGYKYRPEAWKSLTAVNGSRPGNVETSVVTVDSAWWGSFVYRAFNVSKADGSNVTSADTGALRIYVPIAK